MTNIQKQQKRAYEDAINAFRVEGEAVRIKAFFYSINDDFSFPFYSIDSFKGLEKTVVKKWSGFDIEECKKREATICVEFQVWDGYGWAGHRHRRYWLRYIGTVLG